MSITRRTLVATAAAAPPLLAIGGCHAAPTVDPLVVDDKSGLNATRTSRNLVMEPSSTPLEAQFKAALREAGGRPVCFAGARHSMGGQSLPPSQGVAAATATAACRIDRERRTYIAPAGAIWEDVIRALDPVGGSPTVTQSNNDFTIGGTLSVNAHGWSVPHAPAGGTARGLRVLLADGEVVSCSATENPELFSACLGGYGLFGALIEAELEFVENSLLERNQVVLQAREFGARFVQAVHAPAARMAYGRLSLARSAFLTEAILVTYAKAAKQPQTLPPATGSLVHQGVSKRLFRGQTGSDAGKRLRWWAETQLSQGSAQPVSRNSLINTSVRSFADQDPGSTDILHEYFVPPEALEDFLREARRLIPASAQDLLNVTLRWVEADRYSLLPFAPAPRIALSCCSPSRRRRRPRPTCAP
jgi:FAD/FMN-containing dehydrogenase